MASHPEATVDSQGGLGSINMYLVSASSYDKDGNLIESQQYTDPSRRAVDDL